MASTAQAHAGLEYPEVLQQYSQCHTLSSMGSICRTHVGQNGSLPVQHLSCTLLGAAQGLNWPCLPHFSAVILVAPAYYGTGVSLMPSCSQVCQSCHEVGVVALVVPEKVRICLALSPAQKAYDVRCVKQTVITACENAGGLTGL